MASNETWAGMIAMKLRYTVHCEPCDRFVDIDMTKLPPDENALGRTFRCSQCGRPGTTIVSPLGALRSVPRSR